MSDEKKRDYGIEMGEKRGPSPSPPRSSTGSPSNLAGNPVLPVLAYCGSSILMTVTNKYVLSGLDFNLNFFLLCVQVWVPRYSSNSCDHC